MQRLLQDVRFGVRLLLKRPAVTAAAILALAMGIGVTTSMFSLADALLMKPIPYLDSDRLAMIVETPPGQTFWTQASPADFIDWQQQSSSFDAMAASAWNDLNITGGGEPDKVQGFAVSANFFEVLGVAPSLGRTFLPEEDQPGNNHSAVLSHALWERRFGSDLGVIGQTIQLDGNTYTVAGVMPKDFIFPLPAEVWTPLAMTDEQKNNRGSHYLTVVGRLKPGTQLEAARSELLTIAARQQQAYPDTNKGRGVRVLSIGDFATGDLTRQYTIMLLCASMFLLLIAAANVANLQYARAAEREKEIAIRLALGAGRMRLIRQLLTESVLLGLMGACLGLVVAKVALSLIVSDMPPEVAKFISGWKAIALDSRALIFTVGIATIAGILSGMAPAFRSARTDLNETLKEGGRSSSSGGTRQRLRSLLVVSEVSLALILLVGAGLMVKGFNALLDSNRSLVPETLLTMRVKLPRERYKEDRRKLSFYDDALAGVRTIPGVEAASISTSVPFGDSSNSSDLTIEGLPLPSPGERRVVRTEVISSNYFQTMRIPLLQGREFTEADGSDSMPVALIGEHLAAKYWPGQDPIGRRVKLGDAASAGPWLTIVGIAGDVKFDWVSRTPDLVLYTTYRQTPQLYSYLEVRAANNPLDLTRAVRGKISSVDPAQPVFDVRTLDRVITNQIIGLAYVAALMGVIGLIALVLSSVGVYGIISYSVAERTHEIGVRMALGAARGDVLKMVVRRGVGLTLAGLGIGLPLSILLARLLSGLIFGVGATDLATFGGVCAVLLSVAFFACYVPARRATRVDPMVALRYE